MKRYYSILLLLFITLTAFADDISFKVSVPNTTIVGQQFKIEYRVNGDGKEFRVADIPGLDVLMGPTTSTTTNMSIINGKRSTEYNKTYTYIVVARQEGDFNIPSATVKVNGRQYTSNSSIVKVLPADKASEAESANRSNSNAQPAAGAGEKDQLCLMTVSKTNVYEGEPLLLTLKILTTNERIQLLDLKLPQFEGFTVQEIDLPENRGFELENYKGKNYYSHIFKQYILTPQRSGKLEIPATTMDLSVAVRTQRQMRSLFDDFFGGYQEVNRKLTSSKYTINVEPLPFGKPASYAGAIGDFKLSSSITTTELKANEALTVKLTISGSGNLRYIKDPVLKTPNDFEVFDPKVDLNIKTTTSGTSGSKTIEYTMIPRYAGDYTIPAVEFSYFDLKTKAYKTISTQTYNIKVEKSDVSDTGTNMANFSNTTKENVKLLGSDIRFIKPGNYNLKKELNFYFGTFSYWLFYIVPFILAIIFFIIYRKQIKENANVALLKNKNANKIALKRLKLAGKYLKEQKRTEFYEEMLKAIWGYLSDKLNIPTSQLTKDNIEEKLSHKGVDKEVISNFMKLIEECEFARYAPAQMSDSMDKTYNETISAIGKMENAIKR